MRLIHRALLAAVIGAAAVMTIDAQTATEDPVKLSPQ